MMPLPLPIKRDTAMLRLKFLGLAGGGALGLVTLGARASAASGAAAGETITVPAGKLHDVIAVAVEVRPIKANTRVELYVDGKLIGTDAVSPFAFVWDTRTVSDGIHQLMATAILKNRRHSGVLSVIVENGVASPPPVILYPSLTTYPSE